MKRYKPIFEAKQVGLLYHFTDGRSLEKMVENNFVMESEETKSNTYTVSFTRDKNLGKRHSHWGGKSVCITVDGNSISNKYKIDPFFNANTKKNTQEFEAEERVYIPTNKKFSILPYIKHIKINRNYHTIGLYGNDSEGLKDFVNNKYPNIKISIVDRW